MNKITAPHIITLKLNNRLAINCFEDVNDGLANKRIGENANPMAFILLHALEARYFLARILGKKVPNPYNDLTKDSKVYEDLESIPPLTEMLDYWNEIGDVILDLLKNIDDSVLEEKTRFKFPIDDETKFGTLTFMVQHETYHIGQLGISRRALGLSAMKY